MSVYWGLSQKRNLSPLTMSGDQAAAGLCGTCVHCRIVQAARSSFFLCGLSFADPRFLKYPPLPVIRCLGYAAKEIPGGPPEPPLDTGEQ